MNNRFYARFQIRLYEYLYLLMIILYAGQSSGLDSLVFAHKVDLIFILPILMTIYMLVRNRVNFRNKQFLIVVIILTIWFIIQHVFRPNGINLTLALYHYYQLVLCFIIIQVFQDKLFYIYEDIVYRLAVLSLVLWGLSVVLPGAMASLFRLFGNGSTISEGSIYVYTMMRLDHVQGMLIRNSGFAWEPGRFACFLCLAIYCNLLINRYNIKKNKRFWLLCLALITTQSTTGIFTLMVLMLAFLFNKRTKNRFIWLLVLVPLGLYIYTFDFAGQKLKNSMQRIERAKDYDYDNYEDEGIALDRMESFVVEWNNFINDPVLGYCEPRYSYFEQTVGPGFFTNNGTMHLLGKYGLLGILYYLCVFVSSKRISTRFNDRLPITYLLLFITISMGYTFEQIVLIMAFSFWGLFVPRKVYQNG